MWQVKKLLPRSRNKVNEGMEPKHSDEIISSSDEERPKPISSCCLFSNIWKPHQCSHWRTSQGKTTHFFFFLLLTQICNMQFFLVLLTWGFFFSNSRIMKWHHSYLRIIFNILIQLFLWQLIKYALTPLKHDHMWTKVLDIVKVILQQLHYCLHFQLWMSGKP